MRQFDGMQRLAVGLRAGILGTSAAIAALLLAGCTGTATIVDKSKAPADASERPSFAGPFATEYAQAWVESDSDFVRLMLEDEEISAKEWVDVEGRMVTCFASEGATFEGHTPDGGYAAQKNDLSAARLNEIMVECEKSSGEAWVGFLWFSAQKNPENLPPEIIVTECMIRNGVVAPDYTPEEFVRDNPTLSFPYLRSGEGQRGALECNADPRSGA